MLTITIFAFKVNSTDLGLLALLLGRHPHNNRKSACNSFRRKAVPKSVAGAQ